MTAHSPLTQDAQQKSPKQPKHRPLQQELIKVMTQSEYQQSCDDAESEESEEESDCFKTLPYQGKFEPCF